jgi:O-antigen/teichoic acid export membrane protein
LFHPINDLSPDIVVISTVGVPAGRQFNGLLQRISKSRFCGPDYANQSVPPIPRIVALDFVQLRPNGGAGIKAQLSRWWSSQDTHIVDLLRGASVAGVLKIFSAVFTFALSIVLGRMLGAEAAGAYFIAFSTVTIAATVGRVGLDSALVRFIAADVSHGQWGDARKDHRTAVAISLTCSAAIAGIVYFCADLLANYVFSDGNLDAPIRGMALAIVPLSLSVLIARALQGLSRIRDSVLVFSSIPTGVALAGTWLLSDSWGVSGAIAAYVIAVTAALIYGWIAWHLALAGRSSTPQPHRTASRAAVLLNAGAPLLIGALLQLSIHMSGTLMLGAWADKADAGVFAVAWRTAILISFALLAINTIAQPKFAALFARREMESLAAAARKVTLLMTVCATPFFLVCFVVPQFVMGIFGSDFSIGGPTLRILAVGQFFNVVSGSVGILLMMSGHEREYRNAQIVTAAVVLTLNALLIPDYGAIGAAIGASSALIVQNVLFGYFVWTRLGIAMLRSRSRRR